jgi:hypothetical protein
MIDSEQVESVAGQQPGEFFGEWIGLVTPAQRKEFGEYLREESYPDFLRYQAELRAWEAKTQEILALLRRHVPADRWQELEDFLCKRHGGDCLADAIRHDRERAALRRHLSAEHWQAIEDYLATGIAKGRVAEALEALE